MEKDPLIGQNLGLILNDFRKNQLFCDLVLQSNDKHPFTVHKAVVASCNYFHNIFNNNVDVKIRPIEVTDIDINEKQLEIVINYLYTGEVNICENVEYLALYETAYKIQLPFLQEYSTKRLEKSILLDSVLQYWRHSVKYNIGNLENLCIKFIGGKTVPFFQHYSKDLTIAEFPRITENRQRFQIAESTFYKIIREWIFFDYNNRKQFVESILIQKIDFTQLSNSFLHHELEKYPDLRNSNSFVQKILITNKKTTRREPSSSTRREPKSSRSSHSRKDSAKRKKSSHKSSTKRPRNKIKRPKKNYSDSYSDSSESWSYYSSSDPYSN